MQIKWLGTAGFEFKTRESLFLTDPFLTRNPDAEPKQTIMCRDIQNPGQIFLSHGHFDHIMDVPQIAFSNPCDVYCSTTAGETLLKNGVSKSKIQTLHENNTLLDFKHYRARAFFSEHVKFDKRLVMSTLLKINFRLFKLLPLFKSFPCGQVLSWRFYIEGKVIQFFGSAGSSDDELKKIKDEPVDILLLPLQGHSDICKIAANYVKCLKPKTVIVQHHDNFYPPISQSVNIQPFLKEIKTRQGRTQVIVPQINESLYF